MHKLLLSFLLLLACSLSNGQVKPGEPVKSGTMKVRKTKEPSKLPAKPRKTFSTSPKFDL